MSSLDKAQIEKLLQEEASAPTKSPRGSRVDPTSDRTLSGWFKQQAHICDTTCPHRTSEDNPTSIDGKVGSACWNLNCFDKSRNKETDRGTQIVVEVKKQYICRYCYLAGYLS